MMRLYLSDIDVLLSVNSIKCVESTSEQVRVIIGCADNIRIVLYDVPFALYKIMVRRIKIDGHYTIEKELFIGGYDIEGGDFLM